MTRIRGFDGLRALAVLAVFVAHRTPVGDTRLFGPVGVATFFVLSGFLIVGILSHSRTEIEAGRTALRSAWTTFFRRRSLRIFPIYYLTLTVLSVLAVVGLPVSGWRWDAVPWHVLYLSNYYEGGVLGEWQGSLSHLWSLSVEEGFYLLAAPMFLLVPARRHVRLCLWLIAASFVGHAVLLAGGAPTLLRGTESLSNFWALALGGLLRVGTWRLRPESSARLAWAGVLGLGMMCLVPSATTLAVAETTRLLTPVLAGCAIAGIAWSQQGRLTGLLEVPVLAGLGRVSYGFYLFHNLFWIDTGLSGRAGTLLSIVANLTASVVLATLSWHLIERPILERGRRERIPGRRDNVQFGGTVTGEVTQG